MEIILSELYSYSVFVIIKADDESKRNAEFENWLSLVDVWNMTEEPYRYTKYELPIEMKAFLASETFDRFCRRFFGNDVVIRKCLRR